MMIDQNQQVVIPGRRRPRKIIIPARCTNPDGTRGVINLEIGEPTRLVNDDVFGLYDFDINRVISITVRETYKSKAMVRIAPRSEHVPDFCDPDFGCFDKTKFSDVVIPYLGQTTRALIKNEDLAQCL